MDTNPERFICAKTAGLVYDAPPGDHPALIQALVFAQLRADQQHAQKPGTRWQRLQRTALQDLEWVARQDTQADRALNDNETVDTATYLSAFADEHLPAHQATAARSLIAQLSGVAEPPSALSNIPTDTFTLAVITGARQASLLTLSCVPQAAKHVAHAPLGSQVMPATLQLSFAEYHIDPDFWLLQAQLQSAVGKYVERHRKVPGV